MRELRIHSVNPGINPSFAKVNFLSTADKTDDDRPIRMAIHARNQKFWLRLAEPGAFLFSLHKVRGFLEIPSTLRLVENRDVLHRRAGVVQEIVAKMMDVLDERFDALRDFPLAHFNAALAPTYNFVARECFVQHTYERAIF